jgi:hypothetical protein
MDYRQLRMKKACMARSQWLLAITVTGGGVVCLLTAVAGKLMTPCAYTVWFHIYCLCGL